jgi:serine/threonine protein kinase
VGNGRYLAPEYYESIVVPESDVFSFGMILYELVVGHPAFAARLDQERVAGAMVLQPFHPDIPDNLWPKTRALISDCLRMDSDDRPSFDKILGRLEAMQFKLMPGVNSSKVTKFVREIQSN